MSGPLIIPKKKQGWKVLETNEAAMPPATPITGGVLAQKRSGFGGILDLKKKHVFCHAGKADAKETPANNEILGSQF